MTAARRWRALVVIAIPAVLAGWQARYIPTSGPGRLILVAVLCAATLWLLMRHLKVSEIEEQS